MIRQPCVYYILLRIFLPGVKHFYVFRKRMKEFIPAAGRYRMRGDRRSPPLESKR